MKINEQTLSVAVTLVEGKRISLSIAQVKEVLKITRRMLKGFTDEEIVQWVRRK